MLELTHEEVWDIQRDNFGRSTHETCMGVASISAQHTAEEIMQIIDDYRHLSPYAFYYKHNTVTSDGNGYTLLIEDLLKKWLASQGVEIKAK
jgi:hypothetical protein